MKFIQKYTPEINNKIYNIFNKYKFDYESCTNFNCYFSDDENSLMAYQDYLILTNDNAKEFFIFSETKDFQEFIKRYERLIKKQKIDIVIVEINRENYDYFYENKYKILKETENTIRLTKRIKVNDTYKNEEIYQLNIALTKI